MRILFVAAGSVATASALTPLASAARDAGHQVLMAANDDVVPAITGAALPAVSACAHPITHFIYTDRAGQPVTIPSEPAQEVAFTGRWFGRMAAAWLPALRGLSRDWRPDVVVGGTMCYSAALLAVHLGVPYVRHTWDAIDATGVDAGATQELAPELAELGLSELPEADLLVDVCPPSLLPAVRLPARASTAMRWIPVNGQRRLQPWMYRRPPRPRVCLTTGSRVAHDAPEGDFRRHSFELLRDLATAVRSLEVEVVVAAPQAAGDALARDLPGVHAGWVPLDVVCRTSELLVHHGGGTTCLTGLSLGTAQVIVPQGALPGRGARRVAEQGAAISLFPGQDDPEGIVRACKEVLTHRSYAARAGDLADEIAALPLPAQVVELLARLPGGQAIESNADGCRPERAQAELAQAELTVSPGVS